jgi:hypothetical protein
MIFYLLLKDQEIDSIMGQNFINLERSRNKYNEDWFVKFLRKLYNFSYNQNTIWFPTESIRFFKYLFKNFPNHKLVLLDFDFIPSKMFNCDYKGKNCPAVYSIIENSLDSITHNSIFDSYSTVKKPVNIYFPVDFELLQIMYKIITGKLATMNKFKYFMEGYSMSEWCESRNGFNPLIHTHHNMSFLLTI